MHTSIGYHHTTHHSRYGLELPQLLGDPYRWPKNKRAMLLLAVALVFVAMSSFGFFHQGQASLADPDMASICQRTLLGLFAAGLTLLGLGTMARKKVVINAFVLAVVLFVGVIPPTLGYLFGLQTGGGLATLVCAGVLALMLLERHFALLALVLWFGVAALHSCLELLDLLPRAPVVLATSLEHQGTQGSWFWGADAHMGWIGILVLIIVGHLVGVRRRQARELHKLSMTDSLTGVYNRRHFLKALASELERHRRYGRPFCILLLDLDSFEQINDVHGHAAGDAVLVQVASKLRGELRRCDTLARLGGDEFAIVMPQLDAEAGQRAAARLSGLVRGSPILHGSESLTVSASFGVADVQPGAPLSGRELLRRADQALHDAKRSGQGLLCVWPGAVSRRGGPGTSP